MNLTERASTDVGHLQRDSFDFALVERFRKSGQLDVQPRHRRSDDELQSKIFCVSHRRLVLLGRVQTRTSDGKVLLPADRVIRRFGLRKLSPDRVSHTEDFEFTVGMKDDEAEIKNELSAFFEGDAFDWIYSDAFIGVAFWDVVGRYRFVAFGELPQEVNLSEQEWSLERIFYRKKNSDSFARYGGRLDCVVGRGSEDGLTCFC